MKFLLVALVFCQLTLKAQTIFQIDTMQGYGGNMTEGVIFSNQTFDHGLLVGYGINSTVNGNINTACDFSVPNGFEIIRKYDSTGQNILWERCYEYLPDSILKGALQAYQFSPDDFYTIGIDRNNADVFLQKENLSTGIVWTYNYGGTGYEAYRSSCYQDGFFYILSEAHSSDGDVGFHYGDYFSSDFWVIKVDTNGNKIWSKVLGGSFDDFPYSVVPAKDGGCYVLGGSYSDDFDATGLHNSPGFAADVYLARLDSAGNMIWHKSYGGSLGEGGADMINDKQYGVFVLAESNSNDGDITDHIGNTDIWMLHIDSSGNILSKKSHGGSGSENSKKMVRFGEDFVFTGISNHKDGEIDTAYGSLDVWVVEVDSNLDLIKSIVLGSKGQDEFYTITDLVNSKLFLGGTYIISSDPQIGNFPDTSNGGWTDIWQTILSEAPVKITDQVNSGVFKVVPNPARKVFEVIADKVPTTWLTIQISDEYGKPVYSIKSKEQKTTIITEGWSRGVYIVRIVSQTNQYTQKILLQ